MANKKLTVYAWAALGAVILMSGCSRDEGPGDDDRQVRFTATVGGSQTVGRAVLSGDLSPNTRTTSGGNEWHADDQVGIVMFSNAGTLPGDLHADGDNVPYKPVTGDAASANLAPVGTPLYWPQTGSYDFAAYYPYGDKGTGAWQVDNDYNLNISVADQTNMEAIDVLYGKATNKSKGQPVAFTFNHVLAKVRVNIKAVDGITPGDLAGMTATLFDLPTTAKLSLSDGTLSAEGGAENVGMPVITPGTGFTAAFEAIVLPAAEGGQAMEFSFTDRDSHYWNIPAGHEIPAGKVRTYNLTVSAEGLKLTGSTITAWDEVDSGSGELLDAIPQPEANSYMVRPGGAPILIPVSQANKAADTEYNLGAVATGLGGVEAGNFTVEPVWGDRPIGTDEVVEEIQPYGEYVYVKPGPREGNMVIAIKDKDSGNIKWSWHIWVTEPVESGTDIETGLTWMDRNLGAKSNTPYSVDGTSFQWVKTLGLYYQWGRKDAFPGSNGSNGNQTYYTSAEPGGTTANIPTGDHTELNTMVRNPLSFAKNYNNYYGSLNVPGDQNKSWNGNAGEKTLYDPCPPGWKVPALSVDNQYVWGTFVLGFSSEWEGFTGSGWIFNGVNGTADLGHYYPASGLRATNGQVTTPGTYGYYWSATTQSGTYGYNLYFYSSGVNPANYNDRTYGFSVRCVAEPSLP